MNFEDKIYIVTGSSSGMGKSCCMKLLDEKEIEQCVNDTVKKFGRIDGLVNAVGIFENNKPFYELDLDEWNRVISVNTTGSFIVSKALE